MTRRAVAYVRRSSGHESPLSLQAQTEAVRAAAGMRGDIIAHTYTDWGRSGGDRARPEFLAMMEAVEAGRVAAVYSYDADRLSRRESTLHLLLDAAEDTDTAIIDRTGRDLAAGDNRLTAGVLASVDAQVLRDITERNRANRDRKRERGDDLGESPYGWTKVRLTEDGVNRRGEPAKAGAVIDVCTDPQAITTVLNAYHAAGSALGAAVLLNAAGIPTHRGRKWHNRGVQDVVEREAPELLPARLGRSHARHYSVRLLSGLLRCHCGNLMSPNGQGWTCGMGARGAHGSPYNVTEGKVLPWVKDEADLLVMPGDVLIGELAPGQRDAIEAKRPKLIDLYLDGTIGKTMLDMKLGELDAALERIDRASMAQDIPPHIDWEHERVEDVNRSLRAMWRHVRLGPDLMPVEAEWIVPEWRRS